MMTQRVRRMPSIGQFQQAKNRAADHRGSSVRKAYYDGREVVGPGTGTSDSIPADLSNGEDVLPNDTVAAIGGGSHAAGVRRIGALISATHTPVHKQRGIASMPPGLAPDTALGYDDGGQVTSTGDPNAARNAAVDTKLASGSGGWAQLGPAAAPSVAAPVAAPVAQQAATAQPQTQQIAAPAAKAFGSYTDTSAPAPNGPGIAGTTFTRGATESPAAYSGFNSAVNKMPVSATGYPTQQYANGGPIHRAMYANGGAIAKYANGGGAVKYADGGDVGGGLIGKASEAIRGRQAQLDAQEAAALGKAPPPTKATVPQAQTSDGTTTQPTPPPKRKGLFGLGILGLADGGPTRPVLRLADGTPGGIPRDQWGNPTLVGSIDPSNQAAPAAQAAANGVAGPDTPDVYGNAPQPTRGPFPAPQAIAMATYPQSADTQPPATAAVPATAFGAGKAARRYVSNVADVVDLPFQAAGRVKDAVRSGIGDFATGLLGGGAPARQAQAIAVPTPETTAGAGKFAPTGTGDRPSADWEGGRDRPAPAGVVGPAAPQFTNTATMGQRLLTGDDVSGLGGQPPAGGMTTEEANRYYGAINDAKRAADAQNNAAARRTQDIGNAAISADWDARTAARNAHVSASSILNGPDAVGYRQGFGTGAGRAQAAESAGIADAARTHANALAANYAGQPGAPLTTQAIAAQGAGEEAQRSDLAGQGTRQAIAQAAQTNPLTVQAQQQAVQTGAFQLRHASMVNDMAARLASTKPGTPEYSALSGIYQMMIGKAGDRWDTHVVPGGSRVNPQTNLLEKEPDRVVTSDRWSMEPPHEVPVGPQPIPVDPRAIAKLQTQNSPADKRQFEDAYHLPYGAADGYIGK